MNLIELKALVVEFSGVASSSVLASDGEEVMEFTPEAILELWMERPNSSIQPMFVGWVLGKGIDVDSFTPELLGLAVQELVVGVGKNVMEYIGDIDGTSKPH
ncbi:MAG: hypothetical protein V3T88_05510 [Nitrosomonadaceae bacterium]